MIDANFITPLVSMPSVEVLSAKGLAGTNSNSITVDLEEGEKSFAATLKEKIAEVKGLEMKSLDSAYAVSMGQTEDIEGAMIDATKASVAIETAVQITTRAVNAYKEIMQMTI